MRLVASNEREGLIETFKELAHASNVSKVISLNEESHSHALVSHSKRATPESTQRWNPTLTY